MNHNIFILIVIFSTLALTQSSFGAELQPDPNTLLLCNFNSMSSADADYAVGSPSGSGSGFTLGLAGKYGFAVSISNASNAKIIYFSSGNIDQSQGTIEFWFKPNWNGTDATNNYFFDTSYNGLFLQHSGSKISFRTMDAVASIDAANIIAGEWHHLMGTWDANSISIYLDGVKGEDGPAPGNFPLLSFLTVGNYGQENYPLNGIIDDFRISNVVRTIDPSQFTSLRVRQAINDIDRITGWLATFQASTMLDPVADAAWDVVEADWQTLITPVRTDLQTLLTQIETGAISEEDAAPLADALIVTKKEQTAQFGVEVGQYLTGPLANQANQELGAIDSLNPSTDNYEGRQAFFSKDIAVTYFDGVSDVSTGLANWQANLETAEQEIAKGLSYAINGFDYAATALTWAQATPGPSNLSDYYLQGEDEITPEASLVPLRSTLCLNGEWSFSPSGSPDNPPSNWTSLRVPHTLRSFGTGDSDAWYKVKFDLPQTWLGKRIKVYFGMVGLYAEVFANGIYCGNHAGMFSSFEIDVTDAVVAGRINTLLVYVEDESKTSLGPPQDPFDQMFGAGPNLYPLGTIGIRNGGGILQDVYLKAYPSVSISDVFITTSVVNNLITAKVWVTNEDGTAHDVQLLTRVEKDGTSVLTLDTQEILNLQPQETRTVEITKMWTGYLPWGIGGIYGDPTLYFLSTRLIDERGKEIDEKITRFGFREFRIAGNRFRLNENDIILQGGHLVHHLDLYNRGFITHYYKVEREGNLNFERFHMTGAVTPTYLDVADELGHLLEPETMFWNQIGRPPLRVLDDIYDWDDPVWVKNWENYLTNWTKRHWNHPSVIMRSPENESLSDSGTAITERFVQFGELIKALDPTRPLDYHSHVTLTDARFDTANFHYPSDAEIADWVATYGTTKPMVIGEYTSGNVNTEQATYDLANYYDQTITYYLSQGTAAIMPFYPLANFLFSYGKPEWMGPWGGTGAVSITWPSLSGPDAKAETVETGTHTSINWFDPSKVEATPTIVYTKARDAFTTMPSLNSQKAPELVVSVTKGGIPQPGVNVFIIPLANQSTNPLGVRTDNSGTAWFVFAEPGTYRMYTIFTYSSYSLICHFDSTTDFMADYALGSDTALVDGANPNVVGKVGSGAEIETWDRLRYYAAGNLNINAGSIEMWVKPYWNGNDGQVHYLFSSYDNDGYPGYAIMKDAANNLLFSFNGTGGTQVDLSADVSSWIAYDWHQVAISWNNINSGSADGELRLLIDQAEVDSSLGVRRDLTRSLTILGVGCNATLWGQGLQGVVDEFMINTESIVGSPASETVIEMAADAIVSYGSTAALPGYNDIPVVSFEVDTANQAPQIDSYLPQNNPITVAESGSPLNFSLTASDPNSDIITYSWRVDGTEVSTASSYTYSPGYADVGTHKIEVVISDGTLTDTREWIVVVEGPVYLSAVGWTLFGSASDGVLWSDCQVSDGVNTYTVSQAENAGWCQGTIYYFDPQSQSYKLTAGDDAYLRGYRGYWMWSNRNNLEVSIPGTGILPSPVTTIAIPQAGWLLFGSEYDGVLWDQCEVSNGINKYSISQAESVGWIEGTIYYFDSLTQSYQTVSPVDNLQWYRGYWMYSNLDGLLLHIYHP